MGCAMHTDVDGVGRGVVMVVMFLVVVVVVVGVVVRVWFEWGMHAGEEMRGNVMRVG